MKKSVFSVLFIIGCLPAFAIQLSWTNDYTSGAFMYDSDEISKLIAGVDGSTGDFIQLIKILPTYAILAPDLTKQDAVDTSGNVLIDSAFIGAVIGTNGEFEVPAQNYAAVNAGDVLYLRIWNAASPGYNPGTPSFSQAPIPLNGVSTVHYGDSATFTVGASPEETFLVPDTSATMMIPEPTTLAVLLMAILGWVGFRKHLNA